MEITNEDVQIVKDLSKQFDTWSVRKMELFMILLGYNEEDINVVSKLREIRKLQQAPKNNGYEDIERFAETILNYEDLKWIDAKKCYDLYLDYCKKLEIEPQSSWRFAHYMRSRFKWRKYRCGQSEDGKDLFGFKYEWG